MAIPKTKQQPEEMDAIDIIRAWAAEESSTDWVQFSAPLAEALCNGALKAEAREVRPHSYGHDIYRREYVPIDQCLQLLEHLREYAQHKVKKDAVGKEYAAFENIKIRRSDFFDWIRQEGIGKPIFWGGGNTGSPKPIDRIEQILKQMRQLDPDLDTAEMPGRKEYFRVFCKSISGDDKKLFMRSGYTFNDYLKKLETCQFKRGARKTDYYEKLRERWPQT